MKHAIFTTCGVLAVAGSLTLSAQTASPRPPTPTPSRSTPARTDEKAITVTGCLKAWDATQTAPAPASAPTAGTATSRFVLTNIEPDTAAAAPASGSTPAAKPSMPGTTAQAPGALTTAPDKGRQYVLSADTGVNLAPHLNHKIRVSGRVKDTPDHSATRSGEAATTASPNDPPRTTTDRTGASDLFATLEVSSVTMISTACTGATN